MADIKISELGAASAVNSTDIFPMTSSGVTVKATAQQIKNYMGVGNIADLNTTDKSSAVAAINEVDAHADANAAAINEVNTKVSKTEDLISNSGDAYDPTRPYKVGELCIYNNVLYRCTTPCSAGSWATNQSCFTQDTLVNVANNDKWKNGGSTSGSNSLALPQGAKEICIKVEHPTFTDYSIVNVITLTPSAITDGMYVDSGSMYSTGLSTGYARIHMTSTYISINTSYVNNINDTSSALLTLFYR